MYWEVPQASFDRVRTESKAPLCNYESCLEFLFGLHQAVCPIQLQRGAQFLVLVWHLPWHKTTETGWPRDLREPCSSLMLRALNWSTCFEWCRSGWLQPAINNLLFISLLQAWKRVSPHLLPSASLDSCWDFPLHLHIISPCKVCVFSMQYIGNV